MAPKHMSSDDGNLNMTKKSCKFMLVLLLQSQVMATLPDKCLVKMEKALNMYNRIF